ncbi:sensor histidine kinase [Taibaiella soli]|uniref:histidine kinase n=1 Tax=Taibaiella soli TaxID=1649169 RepID=A0A2W2AUB3_9BACT|nr:sensor histidine kinase [Taibaiella soli]
MRQYLNWKTYLLLAALGIVTASLVYTNKLAKKLEREEKKKMVQLVRAIKTLNEAPYNQDLSFMNQLLEENTTVPFIIASGQQTVQYVANIDTVGKRDGQQLLEQKLKEFSEEHPPIVIDFGFGTSYVYYGDSYLLKQLRYFPYVQLGIISLFLIVALIALSAAHRSIQNQVWVGLSKETAHQLGTPLSSIEAWLELLKDHEENKEAVEEMQKDLDRLKLVADRFSKVGSSPQLEEENLVTRVESMVHYMQKRAPSKVKITIDTDEPEIPVYISGPLFDWVLENLMRNALDAMDGKGSIAVKVVNTPQQVFVDVQDTGKGIAKHQIKKVFNPGFTTKKRGWGLGLSLSRRIIEKYHHGSLFVKSSEVGKGTTFRIILRR